MAIKCKCTGAVYGISDAPCASEVTQEDLLCDWCRGDNPEFPQGCAKKKEETRQKFLKLMVPTL